MARKHRRQRWHGGRALLNGPGHGTTAAIVAEIEDTSTWLKGKDGQGDDYSDRWIPMPACTLQIANCDRSIAFEFEWETDADRANNVHKIDTMIDALQALKAGVILESERYVQRKTNAGQRT
jgi:hypothetical protein